MRTPSFWSEPRPSVPARLLQPAGALYGAATSLRMARQGVRLPARVICVGNLTAGGAGKTPVALALAALVPPDRPIAFLSRGHGGAERGPLAVDPARHDARSVGDEPLLLARHRPTVIARDRAAGGRLCVDHGAKVILMDDGLQNPSLIKDRRLAVVDGETGIGNGLCLPAGPLRAPLDRQWDWLDAVVLMGEGTAGEGLADAAARRGKCIFRARLETDLAPLSGESRPLLAFAGIGRPEKFFRALSATGHLAASRVFADHHPFSEREATALLVKAEQGGFRLVTTEKDAVRLQTAPEGSARAKLAASALALPATVRFEQPEALATFAFNGPSG